jgi:hypothetical protein
MNFFYNEPCKFMPVFQFINIIFAAMKNQLIYHWFFMIIMHTVIKVLIKTVVYCMILSFHGNYKIYGLLVSSCFNHLMRLVAREYFIILLFILCLCKF